MPPIPDEINKALLKLKAYFPYRIVWLVHKNGEWAYSANKTRRQLNDKLRAGWVGGIV